MKVTIQSGDRSVTVEASKDTPLPYAVAAAQQLWEISTGSPRLAIGFAPPVERVPDEHVEPEFAEVTVGRRTHRYLNLIGMNRPWTCSLHGMACPPGPAGCPECVAEHEGATP